MQVFTNDGARSTDLAGSCHGAENTAADALSTLNAKNQATFNTIVDELNKAFNERFATEFFQKQFNTDLIEGIRTGSSDNAKLAQALQVTSS